jgi:spermidine synthase
MRKAYLKYYNTPSTVAPMKFVWDAVFTRDRIRRLSTLNRLHDYNRLTHSSSLMHLHAEINRSLYEAARLYDGYDYGGGYFYQSMEEINVTGLRNTTARVVEMRLRERLHGMDVLEIGGNTGFLANAVADVSQSVTCFDINPHLVNIARITAQHLGHDNINAIATAFEDFEVSRKYDAVLSFANHSTYDGNTRQTVEEYILRCRSLLRPGGLFLFESHPPAYEGDGLAEVCRIIESHFHVEQCSVLDYGTFLDQGRTFIVAHV